MKDAQPLPMNQSILKLYSELESCGSLLEALSTVQQQCTWLWKAVYICLLEDHMRALWIGQTAIADPKQSVSDCLCNRPCYFSGLGVTWPFPCKENLTVCLIRQHTGVNVGASRLVFSLNNGNCSVCGQFGFKINCNKLLIDWWGVKYLKNWWTLGRALKVKFCKEGCCLNYWALPDQFLVLAY